MDNRNVNLVHIAPNSDLGIAVSSVLETAGIRDRVLVPLHDRVLLFVKSEGMKPSGDYTMITASCQ